MNANARELAKSFDLENLTAEFYADPYPTYRALREHEPVKPMRNGSYFLTRRSGQRLQKHKAFLIRKEKRVFAEIRRIPAVRTPPHQPRLQRPAGAYQGAAADHGRAVAARDRGNGALPDRAGGPAARQNRRQR